MSRRLRLSLACALFSLVAAASAVSLPSFFPEAPMVTLIPNGLHFAKQAQGTSSAPQKMVLTNSGNGDLVITGMTIGGTNAADFSQTSDCPLAPATLAPGANCTIQVIFKPSGTGEETAALSISDNAPGSPQNVPLSGTATPPVPAVKFTPASLNFGDQAAGTKSAPQTVRLANTGSATLNITGSIAISGENRVEFALVAEKTTCPLNGGQLPPDASCLIAVTFSPATVGAKAAQLTVVDDAEGSPHPVPLAGVGTTK